MTLSLVVHGREIGMFGMAMPSSSPAVAARCGNVRAGVMLADTVSWPVADHLRCDRIEDRPIAVNATAWDIYKPQLNDDLRWALDPGAAPSYGVPIDDWKQGKGGMNDHYPRSTPRNCRLARGPSNGNAGRVLYFARAI